MTNTLGIYGFVWYGTLEHFRYAIISLKVFIFPYHAILNVLPLSYNFTFKLLCENGSGSFQIFAFLMPVGTKFCQ